MNDVNDSDYQALFSFVLTHGRDHTKQIYITKQGGSIAATYMNKFKPMYPTAEKAVDAVFALASDAWKSKRIMKKLGITHL